MKELFYATVDIGTRDSEPYKISVFFACAMFIFSGFSFPSLVTTIFHYVSFPNNWYQSTEFERKSENDGRRQRKVKINRFDGKDFGF